jgi:hypothetical protein
MPKLMSVVHALRVVERIIFQDDSEAGGAEYPVAAAWCSSSTRDLPA